MKFVQSLSCSAAKAGQRDIGSIFCFWATEYDFCNPYTYCDTYTNTNDSNRNSKSSESRTRIPVIRTRIQTWSESNTRILTSYTNSGDPYTNSNRVSLDKSIRLRMLQFEYESTFLNQQDGIRARLVFVVEYRTAKETGHEPGGGGTNSSK